MMTSAAVLLAAVLLLGGLLAVLGDRLGTKVGKARLRLFGLRPRQTATVVTVLTGFLIAASTLSILFALSKSLRQGVFQLDEILAQKRIAEGELESARSQKDRVEEELGKVREDKTQVEQGLIEIQKSFNEINKQVGTLRAEIRTLRSERQQILREKESLARQRDVLLERLPELQALVRNQEQELTQLQSRIRTQEEELEALIGRIRTQEEELAGRDRTIEERERQIIAQDRILRDREQSLRQLQGQQQVLQAELNNRDSAIAERDEAISQLDEAISQLDEAISQRDLTLRGRETQLAEQQTQLADLAQQRDFLEKQIKVLAQDYQGLRQGNLAIARGQVLGFGVVRIVEPAAARGAIEQILREANRTAIIATHSNSGEMNERVVQITQSQVEDLIDRIDDGQDYVVRILSAGNYVEQEKNVLVVADVALNREIFQSEETVAMVSLEEREPTPLQIEDRLDLLLAASQFRARRAGLLGDLQVGEGQITTLGQIATLTQFIEQVIQTEQPIDRLEAIAAETTYAAGPLKLKLVAMQEGEVVFSTQSL
ncbi:MAG: DUF3084 domain-containing protein [Cyanobacteriota bacterium]|nr:DUF3084 domain-containing protein [Cyanobacteriota bacterium]